MTSDRFRKKREAPPADNLSDLDRLYGPRIATGGDVWADIENLITFHTAAKEYQRQARNIDYSHELDRLEQSSKEVSDVIRSVGTTGPDMDKFRKATEQFKQLTSEQEGPEGERKVGAVLHKAWKLYRIAEGDYYLQQAENARKAFEQASSFTEETTGYGEAQAAVARMRKFIGRVAGSRTDIYTEDKRFIMPEMAQRLGVYQTPGDLARKATEPIGEDKALQSMFENIVSDLQKDRPMVAPIDKARIAVSTITGSNTELNKEMISLMQDGKILARIGSDTMNAWDFDLLAEKVSRLRAALERYMKFNLTEDFGTTQKKNLEGVIKYLKSIENSYSMINVNMPKEWGVTGDIPVPKWLAPKEQLAMHRMNVEKVQEYFQRPEEEGGARVGEVRSYPIKVLNQTGQVVKNVVVDFTKYGKSIDDVIVKERDLAAAMQGSQRGFRGAIVRAMKWGAASTVVYGGFAQLKQAVGTLADIELSLAQLRMVMNPLESDIDGLSATAVGFAKQYGLAINDVLKSMKVFAQQGLTQAEIIDRTKVATLAANVTTLEATDATEALTAAMKVFKDEGGSAMRFLDSWSEVEAKHAITAGDMANAIKKAASAAKTAGLTFDQLNGIVAAIGSTTRQTGKEVGTSLRFILRRLSADKGPKQLAKLGIPTLEDTGGLRKGFDVLDDLSKKWKDLSSAQKLATAQAIGGTRQYNSLIVLMENWDQALKAVKDSTNSKGSAERRNAEIMKTYRKQVEQTKAAMVELQMAIGKVAMPLFKAGLAASKSFFEVLSAIPGPIKAAGAGFLTLLTYMTKGQVLADGIARALTSGKAFVGITGAGSQMAEEFAKTKYELLGLGGGTEETMGLKTLGKFSTKDAAGEKTAVARGTSAAEFQSTFGKLAFRLQGIGREFNELIVGGVAGAAAATTATGRAGQTVGTKISGTAGLSETIADIRERNKLTKEDITGIIKDVGIHAALKQVVSGGLAMGAEVAGMGSYLGGKAVEGFGDSLGGFGDKIKEVIATDESSFVASVAPLLTFTAAMVPATKALFSQYKKMTQSSQDYAKSMYGVRRSQEGNLSELRSMADAYSTLQSNIDEVNKTQEPEVKARRMGLDTYTAPIVALGTVQEDVITLSNQIAEANSGMALGYDKVGNAIIKVNGQFESYFNTLDKIKTK
ncbi:MAG: phage tail tape measure protein, partial [Candidatus Caldatribacteriota bacterium]|nr:phage tail tape measure protein [Candidatus Caldatribacteriota bacterium]